MHHFWQNTRLTKGKSVEARGAVALEACAARCQTRPRGVQAFTSCVHVAVLQKGRRGRRVQVGLGWEGGALLVAYLQIPPKKVAQESDPHLSQRHPQSDVQKQEQGCERKLLTL